jgi:mannose-6-phosphate isomerase
MAIHTTIKPWGKEERWALSEGKYAAKILHINKGHQLSRQYHVKKDETFLVQSGEMDLDIGLPAGFKLFKDIWLPMNTEPLRTLHMKPGDTFHCKPLTVHRMSAITDTVVIEVSTPELDDVVRLEDSYGREGTSKP